MRRALRISLAAGILALALLAAGFVAVVIVSAVQPLRLGYDGERTVGLYRMQLVDYEMVEQDGPDRLVIHDRRGGPIAALHFLRRGDVRR